MSFYTEVGDLVEFTYNGGSHPGSSRVVVVRSADVNGFAGEDVISLDSNKYRRFEFSKVSNFKLLRRNPVVNNTVKYDTGGVVFENKNGDKLTINFNSKAFGVYLMSKNSVIGSISFSLPNERSDVISGVFDLLKKFTV